MCDCSSSEESNKVCDDQPPCATSDSDLEPQKPGIQFMQVEVTKSALDLISDSGSSSSSDQNVLLQCQQDQLCPDILKCQVIDPQGNIIGDATCPQLYECETVDFEQKIPCSEDDKEEEKVEKDSLHTCTCSDTCPTHVSEPIVELIEKEGVVVESTLGIIKPEAMMFCMDIERMIIGEGFNICQRRFLKLTPEQASDFYKDDYQIDDFARIVTYMSSGPILVFLLTKINAVEEWNMLIGPSKVSDAKSYAPDSIRGKFGRKGDDIKNVVHGSENRKIAEKEIHFFFPDRICEPLLKNESVVDFLLKEISDILLEGLTKCCEAKPEDPVTWLGNWLLDNNSKRPKYLLRY